MGRNKFSIRIKAIRWDDDDDGKVQERISKRWNMSIERVKGLEDFAHCI